MYKVASVSKKQVLIEDRFYYGTEKRNNPVNGNEYDSNDATKVRNVLGNLSENRTIIRASYLTLSKMFRIRNWDSTLWALRSNTYVFYLIKPSYEYDSVPSSIIEAFAFLYGVRADRQNSGMRNGCFARNVGIWPSTGAQLT